MLVAALLTPAVLAALAYDPFLDGPRQDYLGTLASAAVTGTALCFAAQWLSARHRRALSWRSVRLALVAVGLSLALAPPALHAGRALHPVRWGADVVRFEDDFAGPALAEGRWRTGGASLEAVRWRAHQAVVEPPPGTTAYLEALLPSRPTVWPELLLPSGLTLAPLGPQCEEELAWRAEVQLLGRYFVVLDWGGLLLQRTPYGLHVSYSVADGQVVGNEVHVELSSGAHTWRLARTSARVDFSLDGGRLWSGPAPVQPGQPRFGETRSDEQHQGRLALDWVGFHCTVAPPLRVAS